MSNQKKVIIPLLVLGFFVFLFGCNAAKKNAQVTPQLKAKEWRPKVREMSNNMGDYDIYAAGVTRAQPWAIGFIPKDSLNRLTGTLGRWYKIEDKKLLDELIGWMEVRTTAIPRLMSVLGPEPDRAFFGYIYSPLNIRTRIVDENTIFVFEPDPAR